MSTIDQPVLGMVLKGYPRISETFISGEILRLEELGFTIRIISMRHPREHFAHESIRRIAARVNYLPTTLRGNIAVFAAAFAHCCLFRPVRTLRALSFFAKRLPSAGKKLASLRHLLQGAYIAARLLPGSGITHLHAHFAHSPTSVTQFAALFAGLDFSFTGHAKDVWTQDRDKLAEKVARAKFVATCTQVNGEYLSSLAPETQVHTVYHGIDLGLFTPRPREATATEPYRILTVARLTGKKGLPTVLRALAILRERGLDFHWLLIGDGEEREELEALARESGLADVVDMPGTKTHDAVLEEYARADLFVLGCQVMPNGDRDGIPNVLVEALAMRLPAVATSVSAIPELIGDFGHGPTGLLAPPRDPEALARAMHRMLTDEDLRRTAMEAGRKRVEDAFDNSVTTHDLARVFAAELHARVKKG
jgi:glycosyltransferase involved in cell wall biosynthesis